jgi:hypothetical protein
MAVNATLDHCLGRSSAEAQSLSMQRRRFLMVATGGTALLGMLGAGVLLAKSPIGPDGTLSSAAAEVFRCVASVVLDGSLEADPQARTLQLDRHLGHMENLLGALPEATRSDLSLLLAILGNSAGRHAFAQLRTPWPRATVKEAGAALQMMRLSSLQMRQQAYHALRDLTNAAFYADPSAWTLMGYPGPQEI